MNVLKRNALSSAMLCGLYALTNQANAADTNNVVDLGTTTVYADSYRTTGTKTALAPEDAPLSYSRIDQQTLSEQQADSVNAALRYETGVTSESRGTVTIFDEYRIRGFATQTNYYNGLRLPSDGAWNLVPQVDAFATEAVEVVKGSASSLYGAGSPGGVINQVAKTPKPNQSNQIRVRFGDHNLKEVGVDSTGRLAEAFNYRLVALARQKDGQMKTTKEERLVLNPSFEYKTADTSVIASLYYQDDPKAIPSTPLPSVGTVYDASYGKLGSDAFAGDTWNNYDRKVVMPSVTINADITDNVTFKNSTHYVKADALQRNTYHRGLLQDFIPGAPNGDRTLVRNAYETDEALTNLSTDNQLAVNLATGSMNHNLLVGAEYQKTDTKITYSDAGNVQLDPKTGALQSVFTPFIDLANPDFAQIDPATLPLTNYQEKHDFDQRQLGFYFQDEVTVDKLTLIAGLRYDDFESKDKETGVVNEDKKTSARVAGIYKFDNGIAPFASFSQSFAPKVGANFIDNKPFKATTADQIEAGVKYNTKTTQASVTAYQITQENVVVSNIPDYTKQNQTGELQSTGVEVSGWHRFNDRIDAGFGYSLTDAEITKDNTTPAHVGNTPTQVAKHKATFRVGVYPTDDLKLTMGARYIGKMQIDRANSDTLPAVTLVDIGGEYYLFDWLAVGLSANNVFDKTYVGSCFDKNNCWYGPARQVAVSFTADF